MMPLLGELPLLGGAALGGLPVYIYVYKYKRGSLDCAAGWRTLCVRRRRHLGAWGYID